MQAWKKDPKLYDISRDEEGKKKLDYYETYVSNFLKEDPVRDWESISRCIELWYFFIDQIKFNIEFSYDLDKFDIKGINSVLDCGCKDGQFVQFLEDKYIFKNFPLGIEIDDRYVSYAKKKQRNVEKGDICNIHKISNIYNAVFSHHVLGLCPDYKKAYQEMLRVCSINGYVITCNSIPGNPKKHYSLIENINQLKEILNTCPKHEICYFDYWQKGTGEREDEFVVILRKL